MLLQLGGGMPMNGEGFAFFRWHVLSFPFARCDGHLNNGWHGCQSDWEEKRR